MRICFFTPTFYPRTGGAERACDLLARGMLARGHHVNVLAQGTADHAVETPYPVAWFPRLPKQNLWPETLSLQLRSAWRRHRFDVIFAFYGYPTGYAACRFARNRPIGVVTTARGGDLHAQFHAINRPRVRGLISRGYGRADRVVAISQWMAERVREAASPFDPPIDVIYNGLDPVEVDRGLEEARAAGRLPEIPGPYVLHMAQVKPLKGHAIAIRGLERLAERFRTAGLHYVFAGGGRGLPDLRAGIAGAGLDDFVHAVGEADHEQRDRLLAHCRFAVSTSQAEGLGMVIVEAMCAGVPVLASDLPAHRELVLPGRWGALFAADDVDAFAGGVCEMLDSDLHTLRARALEARKEFTLEGMLEGIESSCRDARESAKHRHAIRRNAASKSLDVAGT